MALAAVRTTGPSTEVFRLRAVALIRPSVLGKGEGRMSWSWRDLVVMTFLVLPLGAAMIANVSDGPMHEYRGSWVARASR